MNMANGGKGNAMVRKRSGFFEKLAFPPVLLVPVLVVALLSRGSAGGRSTSFMPALFAMLLSYGVMSAVFVALRKKDLKMAANAVSLLANGVLLIFVSIAMGLGGIAGWIGAGLVALGLVLAMAQIIPPSQTRFAQVGADLLPESVTHHEVKKLLDAMNFPCAFLKIGEDGEERVISANEQLANLLGKKESQLREELFSSVIPNNGNSAFMKILNREWTPNRTTRGTQTLFMLIPVTKTKEQVAQGPTDAIDRETGLFTPLFLKYRANADVEACRRYGRKLSVVLFRISFDDAEIMPKDEAKKKAYVDFGKMVAESLRACDSGYRLNEEEVLLYLPDTGQSGSQTVVGRIDYKAKKLSKVECPTLASAKIKEVTVNYFGDEVVSVDQVMKDIYVAIGRKKE
jgi:uncharacterized membrane protein YccF (DUF307 family)